MEGFGIVGTGVGKASSSTRSNQSRLHSAAKSTLGAPQSSRAPSGRQRHQPVSGRTATGGSSLTAVPRSSAHRANRQHASKQHQITATFPALAESLAPTPAAAAASGSVSSNGNATNTSRTPAVDAIPGAAIPEPKSVTRATVWNPQVEDCYRYQEVGWRDAAEYEAVRGIPEKWRESGFVAVLTTKKGGNFVYFDRTRECAEKYLHRVKVYTY